VPKLDRNVTGEWFVLDFIGSRARFTHLPSGDTCLRHPYMVGTGTTQWLEKFGDFLSRHPKAHVVVNDHGEIVDDVRDFPISGGGFKVGDLVVTRSSGVGKTDCVREIVASVLVPPGSYRDPGDLDESFVLENGSVMYWGSDEDGWVARDRTHEERSRARRPVEGDNLERLAIPSDEMLAHAIRDVMKPLVDLRDGARLLGALPNDPEAYGRIKDELLWLVDEMATILERLTPSVWLLDDAWQLAPSEPDPELDARGASALARVADLAREVWNLPRAEGVGLHGYYAGLGRVIRRAGTVTETMRKRGVLPEPSAAPALAPGA
jgi:hypothetical protein